MAFDPTKYKPPTAKKLPVILLLDVSGSMDGEKINNLYDATVGMVDTFVDARTREVLIDVAIITFGASVDVHTAYTSAPDLQRKGIGRFNADGMTPLGVALTMAKDMIEDKAITPTKVYRPAVILVSDGAPTDNWKPPLMDFLGNGRSSKCQRFAVSIGHDADRQMLEQFTGIPETVFFAESASDIVSTFQQISSSISMRSTSQNPNFVPTLNQSFDKPSSSASADDDDGDEF